MIMLIAVNHQMHSFPTAIHIAVALEITHKLLPALLRLEAAFNRKSAEFNHIVKIGRTHLARRHACHAGARISA